MQETQEMQVRSLGQEDHLEEETANHSSILAWEIPMDRGAWRATVHGIIIILIVFLSYKAVQNSYFLEEITLIIIQLTS